MSIQSPRTIAWGTSGLITLFFSMAFSVLNLLVLKEPWWVLGILAPMLFVFSFILIRVYLNRFFYNRIKLIYKSIYQHKQAKGSGDLKSKVNDTKFVEGLETEVYEWAQAKSAEIEVLKQQEKFRREFIGNISHELKTPIFNIQGYILTLLDGGLEDQGVNREYLKRTEKSVDRMITIINDLETIARIESGEHKLQMQKFDIHALAHDVIETHEIRASEKKIRLVINSATDHSFAVSADRNGIRQVLDNLVDNSIKYGKAEGRTKIGFFDMDELILVEVTDDGIGIAEEELPRVFERFYRSNRGRAADASGSGLGLAIVKHIVEAHGQTINVRSTIGIGTTFAFTLKKG